ncbi:MAG: trehalose-phosphatase [Rubrivivax sp.]
MMKPALGGSGRAALARLGAAPSLLAFDFDGTLAPIVARRGDARVPLPVARRLKRLCQSSTVAVFSGRSEDDVLDRLGFEPGFVVGNHGIPRALDPQARAWVEALDPARRALARHAAALDAAGVQVEDKQRSIALHYRLATDRAHALQLLQGALPTQDRSIVVTNSKCTLNVAAAGAPDKCDALASLVHDAQAQAVLFIGDESNDATLFARAPAEWVTVRIEPNPARSSARFYLDGLTQLTTLLQALLDARAAANAGHPPS